MFKKIKDFFKPNIVQIKLHQNLPTLIRQKAEEHFEGRCLFHHGMEGGMALYLQTPDLKTIYVQAEMFPFPGFYDLNQLFTHMKTYDDQGAFFEKSMYILHRRKNTGYIFKPFLDHIEGLLNQDDKKELKSQINLDYWKSLVEE